MVQVNDNNDELVNDEGWVYDGLIMSIISRRGHDLLVYGASTVWGKHVVGFNGKRALGPALVI